MMSPLRVPSSRLWARLAALLTVVLALRPAAAAGEAFSPESLDARIQSLHAAFDAPGVAVAIVRDGRVILTRGYGVRDLRSPEPVDERTRFYLGSVSKSFTVLAIGLLADQGKLRVDDPVTRHLPGFRAGDSLLTRQITIRDLLAHRTGLPRADLLMLGGYGPSETLDRLGGLQPIAPLRTRLTYQNQMYLAAGEIVSAISGRPYADFVEERLLRPMGMLASDARGIGARVGDDLAVPHARIDGAVRAFAPAVREPYGAGAINSCALDMARYLQMLGREGMVDSTRLVNPAVVQVPQQAQMVAAPLAFTPDANLVSYGLGWYLHDYHGVKVVQHGGNAEGWSAVVGLVPAEGLGVAVLTNVNASGLPFAVLYSVVDAALGRPGRDWAATFLDLERRARPGDALPDTGQVASAPRFRGRYAHPCYGVMDVVEAPKGKLELRYGRDLAGRLVPLGANVFGVRWNQESLRVLAPNARVTFADQVGPAASFALEVGSGPISFTRSTGP
jgi:CubicO group peptidase (beta-lactamase class C family)